MTKESILHEISEIFSDIFDNQELTINMSTTAKDIEEWDSLAHIRIIVATENKFKIKFTVAEMSEMMDVRCIVEAVFHKI